jgi:TPR repeat protein
VPHVRGTYGFAPRPIRQCPRNTSSSEAANATFNPRLGTVFDEGDLEAMHRLGQMLQLRGGDDSTAEAKEWYRRAADENHPSAMNNLGGLLCERGDFDAAEQWCRRVTHSRPH